MPAPRALTETKPADAATTTAAAAAAKAATTEAPAKESPADKAPGEKPARPEWLGTAFDGYWDPEKGVDAKRLETDFGSLQSIKLEKDARDAAVPKDAKEYEVTLPEGFQVPEGLSFEALKDNPIVEDARAFAQKNGLSKDAFKELVGLQAKQQVAEYKLLETAATQQKALLGPNANARVEAVVKGLPAALSAVVTDQGKAQKMANSLLPMMFTAEQIETFEALIKAATKGAGPKLSGTGRETAQPEEISDDAYNAMSPTQRLVRAHAIADAKRAGNSRRP